ncbi:hypothetical protein K7432_002641 [Basidiobolus ranarum]|uniref:CRIB domain-containing protein n=1 Tax=Basidiobolus ranarum TaxID=34480 RepID=A0ABR2W7H7_9FUNG
MTSYEVDWVAPLAGPIPPPKHVSLPPAWRKRDKVNDDRVRKSKSQHYPDVNIHWSRHEEFDDKSTESSAKIKPSKSNKLFSSIVRSVSSFLKSSKKPEISTPFNFLHCGHAGIDPVTKDIIGLPTNSLNLVPLDQVTPTSYPQNKPLPLTPGEIVAPRAGTLPRSFSNQMYDRAILKRSTTCINNSSRRPELNAQRWSLQSNRDERLHRRNSRFSIQSQKSRKNLEISCPFNPMHVAHIAFTKDGGLVSMPQSWRQSLVY